jgi:peptidoglycan/xylan/chitin deacetylase (PgdA/CDA1 family)
MLHRVLPDAPAAFGLPDCYRMRGTALTASELAHVLDEAGPILPLDAVERALANGDELPVGTVLTFDDGYREHLDVVAPMLTERGATATFYVATGLHGAGRDVAVVDAWYWLLDRATRGIVCIPMPGGSTYRGRLDTFDGKAAWVGGTPKAALLSSSREDQCRMIDALAEGAGCSLPQDLASRLYLRPDEWATLQRHGMRVGAHSVGHPRLTQVDDRELDTEVGASVDVVRPHGVAVAFAYPDGDFDERVVERVRLAGVSSAVTCEPGPLVRGADLLRLPRVFVDSVHQVHGSTHLRQATPSSEPLLSAERPAHLRRDDARYEPS